SPTFPVGCTNSFWTTQTSRRHWRGILRASVREAFFSSDELGVSHVIQGHYQAYRLGQGLRLRGRRGGPGVLLPSVGVPVVRLAPRGAVRDVPDRTGPQGSARRERPRILSAGTISGVGRQSRPP